MLQVHVKDPLRELSRQGRVTRERLAGRYLYCSSKGQTRRQQLRARRWQEEQRRFAPFPDEAVSSDIGGRFKRALEDIELASHTGRGDSGDRRQRHSATGG